MINYFNTIAEYQAAAASDFESRVSFIAADNVTKVDGRNVVVGIRSARTGSIVVLDGNSALHFIALDTYSPTSFPSNYSVVGVVAVGVDHPDYRGKIAIVHKANASKAWSQIYSYRLTGYTLDGTDRTGVLSIREASNSWASNVDYEVAYNADNLDDFIDQLNEFFQDTTNPAFQAQNWRAIKNGEAVDLVFLYTSWQQANYDTGKTGFSLSANLLPDILATSAMLRKNGQRSGDGAISNWDRALAYYRNDNGTSSYQGGRTSDQGSNIKQTYPINLPTWLGTSTQNPGDFCAGLRAIYGEGEAGWLKFMATCLPLIPTQYGIMGDKKTYGDSKTNTYKMAGKTFEKQDGTTVPSFPAADYCAAVTYNHDLLSRGNWVLPDAELVSSILKTIKYGTSASRTADPVNRALLAIGGSAISNGSSVWSSSRNSAYGAWYALGGYGYFYHYSLCNSYLALPVVLLDVSEANA